MKEVMTPHKCSTCIKSPAMVLGAHLLNSSLFSSRISGDNIERFFFLEHNLNCLETLI